MSVPDLEKVVAALEARLAQFEAWRAEHEIGRIARQAQVDAALAELRRMRKSSPT